MPILQVICEYIKNQVDPKEAFNKLWPNAGLAASKIKSYMQKMSRPELQFDVPHAYIASNIQIFLKSWGSKRR